MVKPNYAESSDDKTFASDSEYDVEKARSSRRVSTIPSLPTLQANRSSRATSALSRQLHRTNSITLTSGPARVQPSARLPVDFRTLSLGVTETKEGRAHPGDKRVRDISALDWHTLSVAEAVGRLGVAPEIGLDKEMAARRVKKNGKNVISRPPNNWPKKIFFYIFGGFGSLLIGASIICCLAWKPLGEPAPQIVNFALGMVLLAVAAIQAIFNSWQDYSTGRVMASISGLLPSDVLVTRDGQTFKIPATELVVGDIVKLTIGTKVPADMRLISVSTDLKFDRSILTGESNAVPAAVDATDPSFLDTRNVALQGTLCTSGDGVGVCVATGDSTVFGQIAKQATGERPIRTSLEVEVTRFVIIIASFAACVAILIAILWGAWLRKDHPNFINVPNLLINMVSVAVAFIPEGLPVCITLSLTVIAGSMKSKSVLCKSLSTVESLGCVDVILSDKTGTLTQNKMTVANVAFGCQITSIDDIRRQGLDEKSALLQTLAISAGLCNDAAFEETTPEAQHLPLDSRRINGDATDTGLFRFASSLVDVSALRTTWTQVSKLAFNSKNKFALKLFRSTSSSSLSPLVPASSFTADDFLLLVKGAPDVLLRRCTSVLEPNGSLAPLNEKGFEAITAAQATLASRGQRVLLIARRILSASTVDVSHLDGEEYLASLNAELSVIGLVALLDPLRDDTADTVRTCRGAGIRFMMVTGDMSLTAASIAKSAGIVTSSSVKHISDLPRDLALDSIEPYTFDRDRSPTSLVISGPEIMTMTDSQWKQLLAFDEVVFARTSPAQKLQIVKAYQTSGSTVAVTGDGVNDAAALKQADVGVALASGSEVAMEAADLILLDKFSSLVAGIESGRLCFENLKKSILYLLPAGSFSELMPVVVTVLFGVPQALSSIQMILICAITDVFPALSLCWEKPESDLLLRRPRDRKKERLADWRLIFHAYFFLGVLESLTAMIGAFYFGFWRSYGIPFSALWLKYGSYDVDPALLAEATARAQSIYFFNLVLMQWGNLLATRTRRLSIFQQPPIGKSSTSNIYLFPAMLAALALGIFFSYLPAFQRVFLTRGISVEYFFLPMAYGVGLIVLDEARKAWNRRRPSSILAKVAW